MKMFFYLWLSSAVLSLIFFSCNKEQNDSSITPVVISASGDITSSVNEFRNLLGATLNTTPGKTSGRREINWDGVPAEFENIKIPSDFFNPIGMGADIGMQRGFVYATDADTRISATNFASLDASNATQFTPFSGTKTFSAVSSNLWNVQFEVAGVAQAASVKGFGAVFSDVDDAASTTLEFFTATRSLGVFKVPAKTTGTHSFLGVYFPTEKITMVRIKQGNAVLASGVKDISAGGTSDLVIMDDFLYNEPQGL